MKHLHNSNRIPYGGAYVLNVPDKGIVGYGMNFPALLRSIREWRRANSVPVGLGFEAEVEAVVCEKYPAECDDAIYGKPKKNSWSMGDVVRGTAAFVYQKISGIELVNQEEANRRSELCLNCPAKMTFKKPCSGLCTALVNLLSCTNGKTTPTDNDLVGCGICGCWTKVAVWYDLKVQCLGVDESMKVAFDEVRKEYPCWKKCVS